MDRLKAIAPNMRSITPLTVVAMALALPVNADAQSDALAQAQSICHDTAIGASKKSTALIDWRAIQPTQDAVQQAGTAWALVFGGAFEPPFQLDNPALIAALPTLESQIAFEAEEIRWLAEEDYIAFLEHSSGWTIAMETDANDPDYVLCILWHTDVSDAASAMAERFTGVFSGYARPFQTLTEVNAWTVRGTYDHDLYIAVSRPRRDIRPAFADIYVVFEHYNYDLTEDY